MVSCIFYWEICFLTPFTFIYIYFKKSRFIVSSKHFISILFLLYCINILLMPFSISVYLFACSLCLDSNPSGSCHFRSETFYVDIQQHCKPPWVPRQLTLHSLHPSSFCSRTIQIHVPREIAQIPCIFQQNISANLHHVRKPGQKNEMFFTIHIWINCF